MVRLWRGIIFCAGSPHTGADANTLVKFARILNADIRDLPEAEIKSGGFVIDTLEASLWCFLTTGDYSDAVLKAVNLGDDTDTTAAVQAHSPDFTTVWKPYPQNGAKPSPAQYL